MVFTLAKLKGRLPLIITFLLSRWVLHRLLTILNSLFIWVRYAALGCKYSWLSWWWPGDAVWRKLFRLCRCHLCLFLLSISSLLALLSRLSSIIELFVNLESRVKELLIVVSFEFLRGEDQFKVATVLRFIIVPLSQLLRPQEVFFFLRHLGFAFDGAALKLQSLLFLELKFLPVAQV